MVVSDHAGFYARALERSTQRTLEPDRGVTARTCSDGLLWATVPGVVDAWFTTLDRLAHEKTSQPRTATMSSF